jgi:glucan phosphorylase
LLFLITVIIEILQQFADDEKLHAEWAAAKLASKKRLVKYVLDVTGVTIDPNSLFDIQIKRIHEYKRQLLNILGAVYRYKKLKVWLLRFAPRNKILNIPSFHFEICL